MCKLIVVWSSGETETFICESEDAARKTGFDFEMIFGNQVEWWGVV